MVRIRDEGTPMPYVEWTPALETGVAEIDDQHKMLFKLINDLHSAAEETPKDTDAVTDAMYGLSDYVAEHFGDEEALMAERNYPGLAAHHDMHQRLIAQTLHFMTQFVNGDGVSLGELTEFLGNWLKGHIVEQDCKFVATLKD
jgi:hemerythrin-like metal-binding protein